MTRSETDQTFEALLAFLRDNRGFDFTGYKRASLMRRVRARMHALSFRDFTDYRDYLETHPEEFAHLFNTILINVTEFFRDPESWAVLARDFIPALVARKRAGEPIRAWSAGCASGQETYTLVMLLAEALGLERFRDQVKVYATDVDEEALEQARRAHYSAREMEGIPVELRDRYFEPSAGGWTFRPDLRRLVIFGRHDLVRDAPISHLDLLTCRNALMYFNAETQARIMTRFHFS
ncbi:MAG: protein-glutamate O-methyltransferase CheR, partial [Gemmatimonadetes bacterium]|nr:protein-glutamate O-methyltransferase CheR [Gemmatimonadota bacterium]